MGGTRQAGRGCSGAPWPSAVRSSVLLCRWQWRCVCVCVRWRCKYKCWCQCRRPCRRRETLVAPPRAGYRGYTARMPPSRLRAHRMLPTPSIGCSHSAPLAHIHIHHHPPPWTRHTEPRTPARGDEEGGLTARPSRRACCSTTAPRVRLACCPRTCSMIYFLPPRAAALVG